MICCNGCLGISGYYLQTTFRADNYYSMMSLYEAIKGPWYAGSGSAPHSHCGGRGFESLQVHQKEIHPKGWVSFLVRYSAEGIRIPNRNRPVDGCVTGANTGHYLYFCPVPHKGQKCKRFPSSPPWKDRDCNAITVFSTKSTLVGGWNHLRWRNPPFGRMKSLRRWVDLISSTTVDFICVSRFHPCVSKDFIAFCRSFSIAGLREFKSILENLGKISIPRNSDKNRHSSTEECRFLLIHFSRFPMIEVKFRLWRQLPKRRLRPPKAPLCKGSCQKSSDFWLRDCYRSTISSDNWSLSLP